MSVHERLVLGSVPGGDVERAEGHGHGLVRRNVRIRACLAEHGLDLLLVLALAIRRGRREEGAHRPVHVAHLPRAHLRLLHLQGVVLVDLQVGVRIVRVRGAWLRLGGGARGIIATWRALLGGPRPGRKVRAIVEEVGVLLQPLLREAALLRAVGVLLGRRGEFD